MPKRGRERVIVWSIRPLEGEFLPPQIFGINRFYGKFQQFKTINDMHLKNRIQYDYSVKNIFGG